MRFEHKVIGQESCFHIKLQRFCLMVCFCFVFPGNSNNCPYLFIYFSSWSSKKLTNEKASLTIKNCFIPDLSGGIAEFFSVVFEKESPQINKGGKEIVITVL